MTFLNVNLFKKMKHWYLDIIGYWVIGAGWKDLKLSHGPQIVEKIPENYFPCIYRSIGKVWWVNELWFKSYIQNCTLSYLIILTMTSRIWYIIWWLKNTKTWICWEQIIAFLKFEKVLNLCLRWHILRSYCFVLKVTFNYF